MADLVTLSEFKAYKGIKSDTETERLSNIVPLVSDFVKSYCNRTFVDYYSTPTTEWFNGDSASVLLAEIPVISITSVETSLDGGVTLTAFPNYYLDEELGKLFTQDAVDFVPSGPVWVKGVKVVYTAGYAAAPDEIKLACFDLIEHYKDEQFTTFKGIGSATQRSAYARTKMPDHITRILEMWRLP
jgi:hypothetical protein